MKLDSVLLGLFMFFFTTSAMSFGLGDVIGPVLQVGAKLGGAAIDKAVDSVKDSIRNPEAEEAEKQQEERKMLEFFAKAQKEIEEREGLRPLQRERLVMALAQQYEQIQVFQKYAEAAEVQRRAERDKLFTTGGLLGLAADAAISSTTVAMARADMHLKAGVPKAQANAVFARAEGSPGTAIGQQIRADLTTGISNAAVGMVTPVHGVKRDSAPVADTHFPDSNNQTATGEQVAEAEVDAFSLDRGRQIHVEFSGSPLLTKKIRDALASMGYTLVDSTDKSDVTYLIEGEFVIRETSRHDGMRLDVGNILEKPTQNIVLPEEKLTGKLGVGVSKFLSGLASANKKMTAGQGVSSEIAYRQEILLVIARQPVGGPETRFSITDHMTNPNIQAVHLADATVGKLFEKLGLKIVVLE